MLNEKLNLLAKFAIFLMILLPIFVALGDVTSPNADVTQRPVQLRALYFSLVILLIIAISWVLAKRYPISYTIATGFFFALGTVCAQIALSLLVFNGYDVFADFGYLLGHVFSESFIFWAAVMGILCGIFTGFAGFISQIGLQKVAASKFNPIQQTANTLLTTGAGILLFLQNVNGWGFFVIGIACATLGTMILGQYQLPSKNLPLKQDKDEKILDAEPIAMTVELKKESSS